MKKIFAILLSICVLSSCTSDIEEVSTGSIYGIVTESETAEPARSIGVELYMIKYYENYYGYSEDVLLLKTVTYDDGSYTFEDLTPGEYRLKIVASGYEETKYKVTVEAGRTARADMQLKKKNIYLQASTLRVGEITGYGATFYGAYEYDKYSPTECGFMYSSSSTPSISGTKVVSTNANYGEFSASVSGLAAGVYYVQAYATRMSSSSSYNGTVYGDVLKFEISGAPVVSTLEATNVSETTATLNGVVEFEGSPAYTEKGFVYSATFPTPTIDDPSSATTKVVISGTAKEFSANVANLVAYKTYYVRAYVTNNVGTFYGDAVSFVAMTGAEDVYVLQEEGLMVQKTDLGIATYSAAVQMCKDSRVAGFNDWRLPTIGELSLLYNKYKAGLIGGFYKGNYCYWSSTLSESGYYYYTCYFGDGDVSLDNTSNKNYIRAVRSIK